MKQILKIGILIFIGFVALISSCTKDTFTEEDAFTKQKDLELLKDSLATRQELMRDSLQKMGGIINYSVAAVLASDATWAYTGSKGDKGIAGLDGVVVTVAQYGKIISATTTANGIASFKDLRIGTVNVNVSKTGYTEVDFVANLPALLDTVFVDAYNLVRHVGTMVPLFSLTTNLSTISGIATVETDLTNDAPEPAANVKIMGVIDTDDSNFWRYVYHPEGDIVRSSECDCEWWSFDYYGVIKQIAIHSAISTATTAADGSFTLQVPSTPDGLPIELVPSEMAANQSILQATVNGVTVFGVQSLRTLYGPSIVYTYSTIPTIGTAAGQAQSAYVQFSAPTGSPSAQPSTVATATAVLAPSGIASVNITSPGEGYTQPPLVKFAKGTAYNSVQAEGTAVVSGGKVTAITVTSPGTGYKTSDNPTVSFIEDISQAATAIPEFTFSITDIDISGAGSGYAQTPPTVTILGSGTGATAHAIMGAQVNQINITNPGSGYTQTPHLLISDNFTALDVATATMTQDNPLSSITFNGLSATLWPASPLPSATIVGDGAGATASVALSTVGKVTGFQAIVGGSGYTSAPEVTLTGGGGFGATATATVVAGAVTAVNYVDQGQGYTSTPTVTFSGGAGSGASAAAILGFPVQSITMTAPGVGYNTVTAINVNNGGPNVNYVGFCQIKYNMGVRSISFVGAGKYFSAVPTVTITPKDGNGSGAAATATVNWVINDIEVDNMGSGYKQDDDNSITVRIDAPTGYGTQATATATLGNGVLSKVVVSEAGQGYSAAPHVYMTVAPLGVIPVKQAEMTATVSNGQITGITIADPGVGYNYTSYDNGYYSITISTYNSVAGATAHANPKSGQIDYIQVSNPGAGYAVVPTVEIVNSVNQADANGFGTGATATAVLTDGRVSSVNVTNAGSGYYVVPTILITIPISSMKAVAKCVVAADGRITGVDFTGGYPFTKGYGYNAVPTVTFFPSVTGKGSGATGVAILKDGQVDNVIMTNQGSGYIGKNYPAALRNMTFTPPVTQSILATAGKAYFRDIYYGTGKRIIEQ
jgi:hypothetical protein